jgi:precorrin-2 dehydrogenase/sirohydrochlorin ferrochelatase
VGFFVSWRSIIERQEVVSESYFPLFLNLAGRRCLVVGAGSTGWQKAESLLDAGALVTVVDSEIGLVPDALAARPDLSLIERPFERGDLAGTSLVVVASEDPSLQEEVFLAARAARVLVNVHDRPALCDFIYGAVLRRGDLAIAVSTGGRFPSLAVRIRNRIARWLSPDAGRALAELGAARDWLHREHPAAYEVQRDRLAELLTPDTLDAIAAGDVALVRRRIDAWLSSPVR